MTMRALGHSLAIMGLAAGLLACGTDVSPDDTNDVGSAQPFTHKMMKNTDENLFSSLAYECAQCTFDQWLAIEPPEGWMKGPPQALVASSGELRSRPALDDAESAVNFIDEVPGDEYELIAKNVDGEMVGPTEGGVIVKAQVIRDTILRFDAGRRVHELTDPDGNVFVLFAYQVDPANVVIPDTDDSAFVATQHPPAGWTYASRVLEEALVLDTPDTATVLAIRGEEISTWEKR